MILLLILAALILPPAGRAQADAQRRRALEARQAEQRRQLEARQAEQLQRRQQAEQRRALELERKQAAARTVIETYEPLRREYVRQLEQAARQAGQLQTAADAEPDPRHAARLLAEAEKANRRRLQLAEKVYTVSRKLEAAGWTLDQTPET